MLVLDETALADSAALKNYLIAASQQSPQAKFQIVFYKNGYLNKHDYADPMCTKINQIFSSLHFEEKKWKPSYRGLLKNFIHFGYEGASLDIFNALQEPFYQLLQKSLDALEKEKISYKVSQFFEELGRKISSWFHNVTIFGAEKTNELVEKAPISVEEKTNIQDDIPVGLQDARLGAEFTRDLNYFELENPKEYCLYFEGFPIQNNLKVDLKSDASSRIFNGDRYTLRS